MPPGHSMTGPSRAYLLSRSTLCCGPRWTRRSTCTGSPRASTWRRSSCSRLPPGDRRSEPGQLRAANAFLDGLAVPGVSMDSRASPWPGDSGIRKQGSPSGSRTPTVPGSPAMECKASRSLRAWSCWMHTFGCLIRFWSRPGSTWPGYAMRLRCRRSCSGRWFPPSGAGRGRAIRCRRSCGPAGDLPETDRHGAVLSMVLDHVALVLGFSPARQSIPRRSSASWGLTR